MRPDREFLQLENTFRVYVTSIGRSSTVGRQHGQGHLARMGETNLPCLP